MKPNFIKRAPAIVSLTALSVVLAAIPARSETTSAAVAAPTSAATTEMAASEPAAGGDVAEEQTAPVAASATETASSASATTGMAAPAPASWLNIPVEQKTQAAAGGALQASTSAEAQTAAGEPVSAPALESVSVGAEQSKLAASGSQALDGESASAEADSSEPVLVGQPGGGVWEPVAKAAASPSKADMALPVTGVPVSSSAADLTPVQAPAEEAGAAQQKNPRAIAQLFGSRNTPPGTNFIGAGASIGDNDDFADFVILSKIRLLEFPFGDDRVWSLSGRPSLAFSNGLIDLRLPATIEFKQATLDSDEPGDRIAPFAGAGVALTLKQDDNSRFDFMLTGGIDYLLTPDWTLTGMVNLLFLSEINVEAQVGLGYNF